MTQAKKTNFRWTIVALLFFATTINYFDRFLMGILAPKMKPVKEI
jgi:ACS family hexuronate transporter-like MFS transporter